MKKVILVGTSHTIQRGNSKAQEFESYIKELCSSYNVNAIAEEIDNKDNYICFDICIWLYLKFPRSVGAAKSCNLSCSKSCC